MASQQVSGLPSHTCCCLQALPVQPATAQLSGQVALCQRSHRFKQDGPIMSRGHLSDLQLPAGAPSSSRSEQPTQAQSRSWAGAAEP